MIIMTFSNGGDTDIYIEIEIERQRDREIEIQRCIYISYTTILTILTTIYI